MDTITEDIERILRDVDVIISENETLKEAMVISIREWQITYSASVLTLAVASLIQRRHNAFKSPRLKADEFVILIFLAGLLRHIEKSGVQIS